MTELPTDDLIPAARPQSGGVPDLKWVNRHLPMRNVCVALGLRFDPAGMIHCWHPERHKAGDRTPSVSIRKSTNRLRCFGCGSTTLSVVDVVMDALSTDIRGAARWLQVTFPGELKYIPKGRHLKDGHSVRPYRVGYEGPIELLVKSGLWASLKPATQRIIPVLLHLAGHGSDSVTFKVQISYRAILRYSGVKSFGTISKALQELAELEWLKTLPQANPDTSVLRDVNTYVLTPYGDAVMEMANSMAAALRRAIEQERELRGEERKARRQQKATSLSSSANPPAKSATSVLLKSTSLYTERSVGQNGATKDVAENCPEAPVRRQSVVSRRKRRNAGARTHLHRHRQHGGKELLA